MGVWGPGIYSNDTAEDLKTDMRDVYSVKNVFEGTEILKKAYQENIHSDESERADFWFALADFQWKKGILTEEVKTEALKLLNSEAGMELWYESGIKADIKKRKEALEKLKLELSSPVPAKKKIKNGCIKSPWKPGDIIAIQPTDKLIESILERDKDGMPFREIELPYYTVENIRKQILLDLHNYNYKGNVHFAEDYQPIINKDGTLYALCVNKYKFETTNIVGLHDEMAVIAIYNYYDNTQSKPDKLDFSKFEFLKIINEKTGRFEVASILDNIKYFGIKSFKVKNIISETKRFLDDESFFYDGMTHATNYIEFYEMLNNPGIKLISK